MGDTYIKAVLVVLLGAITLWGLSGFFMKNPRGAWDERTKVAGLVRKRHWSYSEYVKNAREYLLPEVSSLRYWPALENAAGYDGVKNIRTDSWRAIFLRTPGATSNLIFSYEVPAAADGSQLQLPEICFSLSAASSSPAMISVAAEQWKAVGDEKLAEKIIVGRVGEIFRHLPGVTQIHLYENFCSFLIPEISFQAETLEILESCLQSAKTLAVALSDI